MRQCLQVKGYAITSVFKNSVTNSINFSYAILMCSKMSAITSLKTVLVKTHKERYYENLPNMKTEGATTISCLHI